MNLLNVICRTIFFSGNKNILSNIKRLRIKNNNKKNSKCIIKIKLIFTVSYTVPAADFV